MINGEVNEAKYEKAWLESQGVAYGIGLWLKFKGMNVSVPLPRLGTHEDRYKCIDEGDIHCVERIEVKHRQVDFTDRETYPFDTIIVDETYKLEREHTCGLKAYVIVSRDKNYIAYISAGTRKHWTGKTLFDKTQGEDRTFSVCPKALARFYKL